jgi:hypothetical protein
MGSVCVHLCVTGLGDWGGKGGCGSVEEFDRGRGPKGKERTSENLIPITYFSQGLTNDSTVIPKND